MSMPKRSVFYLLLFSGILFFLILLMQPLSILQFKEYIAILFPKGLIALEQRNLLFIVQALMLLVIVPVYILTFIFSWIYRHDNPKGKYDPDLVDNRVAEYVWWGVPLVMVAIVSVLSWVKTYELDPYNPIESNKNAKTIQVVALQWKWLFIYPEEKIAVVNFMQIPKDVPIHFEITADAPMNSFWIPSLGGQIYAMPKMQTELNLIANEVGDFRGLSANISGEGFAGMTFVTRASTEEDYQKWVETAKKEAQVLSYEEFNKLVEPTTDNPVKYFRVEDDKLFEKILYKYM